MSIGKDLIESLQEACLHAEGKLELTTHHYVTMSDIKEFSSSQIKELRTQLGYTQFKFASVLGVSVKTVEAWERGKNSPSGASSRLLELITKNPLIVNEFVAQ